GALGEIHVAAAADAHHDVGTELASDFPGGFDEFEIDVGPAFGEDEYFGAAFLQQAFDFFGNAALDDVFVRADHHLLAKLFGGRGQFLKHPPAEENASGCGITPMTITYRLWSGVALRHAKPPRDVESL